MNWKEKPLVKEGFMTVRHVTMDGTNFEIGKTLAEIAIKRHKFSKETIKSSDSVITGARKEYYARNYPIHAKRAQGVAEALNVKYTDNMYDTTAIPYNQALPFGCSTVYFPPDMTVNKTGCMSRNFDFPVVSLPEIMGISVPPSLQDAVHPVMADPYIIELHPDEGYDSLCITSFDLLSCVLEGVNSQGLIVALNGDETAPMNPMDNNIGKVGLHELQLMRVILDTCATVKEAKNTLLTNKHYYQFMPCHYIIADLKNCFVFEFDHSRNTEYIIPGEKNTQIITNHLLHMYPAVETMPSETGFLQVGTSSFQRFKKLAEALDSTSPPYTPEFMKELNDSVSVSKVVSWVPEEQREKLVTQPGLSRTLWHNLLNNKSKTMEIKFYTGEEYANGNLTEQYTDYFQVALN